MKSITRLFAILLCLSVCGCTVLRPYQAQPGQHYSIEGRSAIYSGSHFTLKVGGGYTLSSGGQHSRFSVQFSEVTDTLVVDLGQSKLTYNVGDSVYTLNGFANSGIRILRPGREATIDISYYATFPNGRIASRVDIPTVGLTLRGIATMHEHIQLDTIQFRMIDDIPK